MTQYFSLVGRQQGRNIDRTTPLERAGLFAIFIFDKLKFPRPGSSTKGELGMKHDVKSQFTIGQENAITRPAKL
ncbi:hypothetical protein DPMN_107691 [Dreissena polymorpha]|uniref:Uncharacterized protein n=1 Tax=Dreissena polymorpha TaxID=45954 RepID=A0A9D4K7G9_DREPO|nr:hypothetical protein DPMN_107691 [Dreissena polymorpha]